MWQSRPLDAFYPIVYFDALVVKVKDGAQVGNKSAHIAMGVDLDGVKHVLGIWVQATEGAKFWAGVCAELANRGVKDILIACCDGLTGLPEAIEATFAHTTVQTCVVHLIRASLRFVSYTDRKKLTRKLKEVYTAATADAAETALLELAESEVGRRNPAAIATWQAAWERFIPFKTELARLVEQTGLKLTVCHLPPGTSKWNKVEHRLFAQITSNWRGEPLTSHQVVVDLIGATTTETGLKVRAERDTATYPRGIKVSDAELAAVRLQRHHFHGDWNYTVRPSPAAVKTRNYINVIP